MKKILRISCILVLLAGCLQLPAQSLRYTQYSTLNGLPSDNVYCAAQDNNGFMYFGTDFGLVKYDGYRFTHYGAKEGLINKPITDMVYAGGDSIIFASYPDALQCIHADGRISTIIQKAGYNLSIQQLLLYKNQLYAYQRNSTQYAILQNGVLTPPKEVSDLTGIKGSMLHCIAVYKEQLVFATTNGLFIKKENTISSLLVGENIFLVLATAEGDLVAIGKQSIWYIKPDWSIIKINASLPAGITALHTQQDNQGDIWIRGLDKGVFRLQKDQLYDMTNALQLQNLSANEFYKDNSNNFWICTNGAGLQMLSANRPATYNTLDGLVSNKVLRLHQQNKKVWIGTHNGLSAMQDGKLSSLTIPKMDDGLQYIFKIISVKKGVVGVCLHNYNGYDTSKSKTTSLLSNYNFKGTQYQLYNAWFAWPENDSITWIHQNRGQPLIRLNTNNFQQTKISLAELEIKKVFSATKYKNSYWFGTEKGVLKLTNGKISLIDSIGNERLRQVMSLLVDSHQQLWLATEVGLFKEENGQLIAQPKAASYGGNYCTSLTEDRNGNMWVATWDGIFSTNGKQHAYYNDISGITSRIVNAIAFDTLTGSLIVGTDNGVTVFKQHPGNVNFSASVFINASLSGTQKKILPNNVSLSPSENGLVFYFSTPLYVNHEDILYEYSLDNGNWLQQKIPSLNLEDQKGGNHSLKVRYRINTLGFISKETVFNFHIKTPFYKKGWFIVAFAIALQALLILLITSISKKRREKQLKVALLQNQQMLEQASLKQQAFTAILNPHFIFNALNSVQHFINQQDRQNANRYLSDFASLIRKNFDASQQAFVPLETEVESLRLYLDLEKMRFGDKIAYNIHIDDGIDTDDWMLPTMILQPFLENAIIHGLMPLPHNGLLDIRFTQQDSNLIITITDNGIGIQHSRQQKHNKEHNSRGMELIKERLQLLEKLSGYKITLVITEAYPGHAYPGTLITLTYPEEVYTQYNRIKAN